MTEKRFAERFIYQLLANDPQVVALVGDKIGRGRMLQGTPPPFIIYSFVSGVLRNALPATIRIYDNFLFQVKAVAQQDKTGPAYDIEDQFDRLLGTNSGALTISGVTYQVGPWVKEADIQEDEDTAEGQHFFHTGGLYRAWVYRVN